MKGLIRFLLLAALAALAALAPVSQSQPESYALGGELPFDFFGHSVRNAGDVNGDGYADLIVGAPSDGDSGQFNIQVDLTNIPTAPPHFVLWDETWNFRFLNRDDKACPTSSFTDTVSGMFH